jgi:hypothetical protein
MVQPANDLPTERPVRDQAIVLECPAPQTKTGALAERYGHTVSIGPRPYGWPRKWARLDSHQGPTDYECAKVPAGWLRLLTDLAL